MKPEVLLAFSFLFSSFTFYTNNFLIRTNRTLREILSIVTLLLITCTSPAMAQHTGNFNITHYNLGNGLATNKIHHATQDSLHRIWFATGYGASVYDGFKWENVHLLDNQNGSGFKKIIVDRLDHKWLIPLVTTHRIKVNKGRGWGDVKIGLATPSEPELITDGDVSVSGENTTIVLSTEKHLFVSVNEKWTKLAPGGETIHAVEAIGDSFFIAGTDGLSKLSLAKDRLPVLTPGIYGITTPVLAVHHIAMPPRIPRVLVLAPEWIGEIREGKLEKLDVSIKIQISPTQHYYYITEDTNGNIYFGNKFIKYFYNLETQVMTTTRREQGFTSEGATFVFVDTENNVWFTDLRGVDKITYHPFRNFYKRDGLLEDEVTAVVEYSPGNFIFGHNTGFTIYSNGRFEAVRFLKEVTEEFQASRVLDLELDDNKNIWAACGYFGLVKIDPGGGFTKFATPNSPVSSVLWDRNFGLLVATNKEIFTINGDSLKPLYPNAGARNFRKLFRFHDQIYAASPYGLFLIGKTHYTNLLEGEDKMSSNVFSMLALSKDSLLLGTEAGLFLFNNGGLSKVSRNGFSISKSVYFILKSNEGYLWFGTADGLIRWNGGSTYHEYIVQDGLAGYEINRSAVLIDSRNRLWVGTNSGVSSFRLGKKDQEVAPPKVWLASVENSLGEKFPMNIENIFSHNNNSLNFSVRGVSFVSESLIKYKIKLEGFDEDFYEITQSQLQNIRYLNLPSGAYRLVVMAKNRFSEWSEPVYSKVILIEKPFYLQTWFILLVVTFLITTTILTNKYFLTSREQTRLEQMVSERTKALADSEAKLKNTLDGLEEEVRQRTAELEKSNKTKDKIFSIISHDLRSPFMSILGYSELLHDEIENMDPPTVRKYTDRIMDSSQSTLTMVDGLLEWSKLQMGGVIPTHEEVNLSIIAHEIEKLFHPQLLKKGLTLQTGIDESINLVTDPAIIRSVIRNLVSNAIKFTPQGGLIKVSAVSVNSFVEIEVVDTGIGIPQEMIPTLFTMETMQSRKGTASEKGTGLGLSLVHDLLKKVGGEISVESTVGEGTVFRVLLPLDTSDILPNEEG